MGTRDFGWTIILIAAVFLGGLVGASWSRDGASPAMAGDKISLDTADVVGELKEIKTQVTEINTLLHTGNVRVIVVFNPVEKP